MAAAKPKRSSTAAAAPEFKQPDYCGDYLTPSQRQAVSKKASRQEYKLDKIDAKTEKAKAVASKRKWTAILVIAGVAAFGLFSLKGCLPI